MKDPETGYLVSKFREIGHEFAVNLTEKASQDLFHVCFGIFDMIPGWAWHLEKRFMDEEGLMYAPTDDKTEDFFKRGPPLGTGLLSLIRDKKTDLVKLVMRKSKRRHGFYLSIRNQPDSSGKRPKRRQKGVYYKRFLVRQKLNKMRFQNAEHFVKIPDLLKKDPDSFCFTVTTQESPETISESMSTGSNENIFADPLTEYADFSEPFATSDSEDDSMSVFSLLFPVPSPQKELHVEVDKEAVREKRSEQMVKNLQKEKEKSEQMIREIEVIQMAKDNISEHIKVRI